MEQIQGFNYAEQQYEQQMPREYVHEIKNCIDKEQDNLYFLTDEQDMFNDFLSQIKFLDYDIKQKIKEQYEQKIEQTQHLIQDMVVNLNEKEL